jgi:hypothetical protein
VEPEGAAAALNGREKRERIAEVDLRPGAADTAAEASSPARRSRRQAAQKPVKVSPGWRSQVVLTDRRGGGTGGSICSVIELDYPWTLGLMNRWLAAGCHQLPSTLTVVVLWVVVLQRGGGREKGERNHARLTGPVASPSPPFHTALLSLFFLWSSWGSGLLVCFSLITPFPRGRGGSKIKCARFSHSNLSHKYLSKSILLPPCDLAKMCLYGVRLIQR